MRPAILALALILSPPARAAEIDLASRIERVTVFPDAALVTRSAAVTLPAGATTLWLRGLPAGIDAGSVRVEGRGAFAIGAVDVRPVPGEARPAADPDLERKLRGLREEHELVGARLVAAQGRKAAVDRFAAIGPERLGPDGRMLDVAQWSAAWDAVGTGLAAVAEELRVLNARARDLAGEIEALERVRPSTPRPGAPKRDVAVAVETTEPVSGDLAVTYRVAGAAWAPTYDLRLSTGGRDGPPGLDLFRRAEVRQRTGEDWTDVALTVSTVRVTRGTAAPDLPPLQADFYAPPVPPPPVRRSSGAMLEAPVAAAPKMADMAEPRPRAVEVQATVETSPFQASYTVPGRVTLAPDGTAKTLLLAQSAHRPALVVTAVPALDETAYLTAAFPNDGEAALLPGEASLHRDGAFVGRARLKLVPAGDTVELGFGADDRVKVTRVPVRRREDETGLFGQTRVDQREFKTTVRNLHAGPVRITVLDRIPYSENAAITVETLKETTLATERQVGDRRGVMAWSYDYAPGATREIRLAYRLRWPSDREIVTEPRPVAGPRS